jgi:Asp-tRNA(Asn)/Glu-tRNA(Gln) amidotransferase A subunit family amidase
MRNGSPLSWPVADLVSTFAAGEVSPVEVTELALAEISDRDDEVGAFVHVAAELARDQARAAEAAYRDGSAGPLAGVPISIKDAFHVRGEPTGLGSLVHTGQVSKGDSGVVRRLRAAGAVFVGKTNTAEFGQSATCENELDVVTGNPWRLSHTPGGSSGGAAASVAAGMVGVAIGSDGGGSVRIPAAFTGVFGFKPTFGFCPDEYGFRGMTRFVTPGPLTRHVDDARRVLSVLSEQDLVRSGPRTLRIGVCTRPEGRPVHPGIEAAVTEVARHLADLGHEVTTAEPDLSGWADIFGPLVLEDEHRERGHLLKWLADKLTSYERSTLRAAQHLDVEAVLRAEEGLLAFRSRIDGFFGTVDVLLTPAIATPAFEIGERPTEIAGHPVDRLWGPFPFAAPFNVAGTPAASLPAGLVDGLPVAVQLVAARGQDALVLDVAEALQSDFGIPDVAPIAAGRTAPAS